MQDIVTLSKVGVRKELNFNNIFIHYSFTINYDSIVDQFYYSVAEKKVISDLYSLSLKNPNKAIWQIFDAINKFPNLPQLYNYLSICFFAIDENEKALQVIQKSIELFPDYLFSKLNYAEHLILNDQLEEIPKLFKNKYDLKLLYPNRDEFHISEVLSFYYTMAHYFIKIQKIDKCEIKSGMWQSMVMQSSLV